jgi:hypothetical protein
MEACQTRTSYPINMILLLRLGFGIPRLLLCRFTIVELLSLLFWVIFCLQLLFIGISLSQPHSLKSAQQAHLLSAHRNLFGWGGPSSSAAPEVAHDHRLIYIRPGFFFFITGLRCSTYSSRRLAPGKCYSFCSAL